MNTEIVTGWKFLDPSCCTKHDGVYNPYPVPQPGEEWGPWYRHPEPGAPDGNLCGSGGWHIMLKFDARFAPINWWPWIAEGRGLLGSDELKARVTEIRLKRMTLDDLSQFIRETNLSYADLGGANLIYADLRGADLRNANLSYADLSGANLSYANLSYADLGGADLSGASLRGADLGYAKLSGADLGGTNLSGANLEGVRLYGANISLAKGLSLPEGWKVKGDLILERESKKS